jgi:hypothetical protein
MIVRVMLVSRAPSVPIFPDPAISCRSTAPDIVANHAAERETDHEGEQNPLHCRTGGSTRLALSFAFFLLLGHSLISPEIHAPNR